jgi:hypothetical protein
MKPTAALLLLVVSSCGGRRANQDHDAGQPDSTIHKTDTGADDATRKMDSGADCQSEQPPAPGAGHDVVFEIDYSGTKKAWLLVEHDVNPAFRIEPLLLYPPANERCLQPRPIPPPLKVRAKHLDRMITLAWDGREYLPYRVCIQCDDGPQKLRRHAPVTVAPGTYTATFAVFDSVPASCIETSIDEFECYGGIVTWPPLAAKLISVSFTLPAAGAKTIVPVKLDLSSP